jgi:phage terminase large subunit-like protein
VDKIGRQKSKHAIGFISNLTHVEGRQFAGKPFHLFMWQKRIIHKLFGTLKPDGYRQYRTCYLEIPKKNGKSELGAAVALLLLCGDHELGAEVYSVASDIDQAGIIFRKAAQMVRNSKELSERLNILDSQKRIIDYQTNSFYRVLSSDVETKHGYNPHGVIFDELHTQPNRKLWDVLTVGTDAARKQQIVFVMTTAGFDRNSICKEVHDHAMNVKKGAFEDPKFLPIFYGTPDDADWEDENEWIKANPSIGKIFDIENLREGYKDAKQIPARENEFRRLRLDQWTQQSVRLIPMDKWDANNQQFLFEEMRGRSCFAGLDLASSIDIAAFVVVFPDEEGYLNVQPYFFVPEENIKRRSEKDRIPYDLWAKQGFIISTPGNVIDYAFIEEKIKEIAETHDLKGVVYDRWGAVQISQRLQDIGINVIPLGQGFASMSAPTKEFLTLILKGKIRHNGNPVLWWMASNIAGKGDPAGNIKPDREKSGDKIDGMVALIMAIDQIIRSGMAKSVYDERGPLYLELPEVEEQKEEVKESVSEENPEQPLIHYCPRCNWIITSNICEHCGRIGTA